MQQNPIRAGYSKMRYIFQFMPKLNAFFCQIQNSQYSVKQFNYIVLIYILHPILVVLGYF